MNRRALLVLNPHARKGSAETKDWRTTLSIAFELIEPERDEDVSNWILRRRDEADAVIVGGGDGTLNSLLDSIVSAGLPLGIIPLGTANDLARTLEIPADPEVAAGIVAAGHTRQIDLGEVNGKHFFNVASLGLSVAITRAMDSQSKRFWGALAYLKAALRIVWLARPFHAEIQHGEETFRVRTVQIAIGNGRHYGGGMVVDQHATIDDGMLDLYSIEVQRWWQVLLLAPRMRRGTLWRSNHVRTLRGQEFSISTRTARSINTDGEITRQTPATFRVVPKALTVFVPAPAPTEL